MRPMCCISLLRGFGLRPVSEDVDSGKVLLRAQSSPILEIDGCWSRVSTCHLRLAMDNADHHR